MKNFATKLIGEITPIRIVVELLFFPTVGLIGTALITAYLYKESGYEIAISVFYFLGFVFLIFLIYGTVRFLLLKRWSRLSETTDLVEFANLNLDSPFMPEKILERGGIKSLWVMGNGCSKWTAEVTVKLAHQKITEIRKRGGVLKFLASCPVHLNKSSDGKKRSKAKNNATSLLALRKLANATQADGGTFEIKTYAHTATLRLIILNEEQCIIGHYTESGIDDSLYSPLLVFRRSKNEWGFGHAFHRLFDHEWSRASEPSPQQWDEIKEIAEK